MHYHASDMILVVDSNTAYLVMPQVKSHITSYFQIAHKPKRIPSLPPNRAIFAECKTLRYVVSSAVEVETARRLAHMCEAEAHLVKLPTTVQ